MNIHCAMNYLQQGVRCRREAWKEGATVKLVREPHAFFVWIIDDKRTAAPCHMQPEDLAADDWQVWYETFHFPSEETVV